MKYYFSQKKFPCVIVLLLSLGVLSGCGGSDGEGASQVQKSGDVENHPLSISGKAQKGPFRDGSEISFFKLNKDGSRSGLSTTAVTNGESYSIEVPWIGATEIIVEGFYLDEMTGSTSVEPINLSAIVVIRKGEKININLFTHLASFITKKLISYGSTVEESVAIAQGVVKKQFWLQLHDGTKLSQLDLTDGLSDSAADNISLLLFSAAVRSSNAIVYGGEAFEFLGQDLADDYQINNSINTHAKEIWKSITESAETVDLDMVQTHFLAEGYKNTPGSIDLEAKATPGELGLGVLNEVGSIITVKVNTNVLSPHLATITEFKNLNLPPWVSARDSVVEGKRDDDGLPTQITSFSFEDESGGNVIFSINKESQNISMIDRDGGDYKIAWINEDEARFTYLNTVGNTSQAILESLKPVQMAAYPVANYVNTLSVFDVPKPSIGREVYINVDNCGEPYGDAAVDVKYKKIYPVSFSNLTVRATHVSEGVYKAELPIGGGAYTDVRELCSSTKDAFDGFCGLVDVPGAPRGLFDWMAGACISLGPYAPACVGAAMAGKLSCSVSSVFDTVNSCKAAQEYIDPRNVINIDLKEKYRYQAHVYGAGVARGSFPQCGSERGCSDWKRVEISNLGNEVLPELNVSLNTHSAPGIKSLTLDPKYKSGNWPFGESYDVQAEFECLKHEYDLAMIDFEGLSLQKRWGESVADGEIKTIVIPQSDKNAIQDEIIITIDDITGKKFSKALEVIGPREAPLGVAAVPSQELNSIDISWQAVRGVESYKVLWSNAPGVNEFSHEMSTATTEYVHEELDADQTYFYKVLGVYASTINGPMSDEVSASPIGAEVPDGLAAEQGEEEGSIVLTWNDISGADSYRLYWSNEMNVSEDSSYISVSGGLPEYLHKDLDVTKTYYYKVAGVYGGVSGGLRDIEVSALPTVIYQQHRILSALQTTQDPPLIPYTNNYGTGMVGVLVDLDVRRTMGQIPKSIHICQRSDNWVPINRIDIEPLVTDFPVESGFSTNTQTAFFELSQAGIFTVYRDYKGENDYLWSSGKHRTWGTGEAKYQIIVNLNDKSGSAFDISQSSGGSTYHVGTESARTILGSSFSNAEGAWGAGEDDYVLSPPIFFPKQKIRGTHYDIPPSCTSGEFF